MGMLAVFTYICKCLVSNLALWFFAFLIAVPLFVLYMEYIKLVYSAENKKNNYAEGVNNVDVTLLPYLTLVSCVWLYYTPINKEKTEVYLGAWMLAGIVAICFGVRFIKFLITNQDKPIDIFKKAFALVILILPIVLFITDIIFSRILPD